MFIDQSCVYFWGYFLTSQERGVCVKIDVICYISFLLSFYFFIYLFISFLRNSFTKLLKMTFLHSLVLKLLCRGSYISLISVFKCRYFMMFVNSLPHPFTWHQVHHEKKHLLNLRVDRKTMFVKRNCNRNVISFNYYHLLNDIRLFRLFIVGQ